MVQVAEQVTAPETIEATLSYFVDTEAMPVTLVLSLIHISEPTRPY